ncbi:MAG: SusC/RagA family TonB-linked outer membrane protein [Ekhidna sp.]
MKRKLQMKASIYLIALLVSPFLLLAQDQMIKGTVLDADLSEGLPGATVKVVGTQNGVITDFDGNFQLAVPADASIEISFVGFVSQIIVVGSQTNIKVILESDAELLDEVVVIGYGEQRKKVATASIAKVSAKDLEGFSVPNVGQALQGQVSGVIFKSTSGQPGAIPQILIRGIGTNGNNNPIVIVDGLIYDDPGVLSAINPDDVESVNILKDGASTAIYGTRGANGVIIVTTKKAKEGVGSITYSNTIGFQSAWKVPEVLNRDQYVELLTEKYTNSGIDVPEDIANGASSPFDSDWMGQLFETTQINSHQLSFAKGTATSKFRASFSYANQEGLIAPEKSNFERITARINSEQKLNDYVSFGQNIFFTQTKGSTIPENNEFGSPIADALVYDPLTPAFDQNAQFGFGQSNLVQKEYVNPLSRIFVTNNSYNNRQMAGNTYLAIEPVRNLTLKTDLAILVSNNANDGFSPQYNLTPAFENETSDLFEYREEFTRWKWENTLNYNTKIDKHKVDVLLGVSAQEDRFENLFGSVQALDPDIEFDPNFQFLDGVPIDTADVAGGIEGTRYAVQSLFARTIYSYMDKYLATFIIRRDGSTKFGENNRYGIFPSASIGWVASSESFWSVPVVNFLKVRVSYGENGSDRIGDNRFRSTISRNYTYQFGNTSDQIIYGGSTTANSANPDLKWERSRQFDIGAEVGLFDDQITIEIDYYKKITSDLLFLDPAAPLLLGTGAPFTNLGEFQNTGIELDITYSKDFGEVKFNAGLNVTTLKSEVTNLNGDSPFVNLYSWPVRNVPITRFEVGEPVGYFRGYQTSGIFRSERDVFAHINSDGLPLQPNAVPGDLRFDDVNGDGVITADDITKIGKPWADVTLGVRLGASYKNFSLSTVWFASIGSEIYRTYERQDVPNNNYQVEWLDRYNENNTDGAYPRVSLSDANTRPSDFFVESGNFIRLRNINLSYTLPQSLIEKVKMTSAKVFLAADNLITLTGYTGFDPEIGGGIGQTGLDRGFYPLSRTISGGISVTF